MRVVDHFRRQGLTLLAHRLRTFYCEIDLIFERPGHEVLLVEVKALNDFAEAARCVGRSQARRLYRAQMAFQEACPLPVRMHLAVVSQEGAIRVYPDFLCDLISSGDYERLNL